MAKTSILIFNGRHRRKKIMKVYLACVIAALLMGCCERPQNSSSEEPKSTSQGIVDTISQRTALEAGRKAGQQIRDARAEQDKKLQETESQ
jgi:hypothetical protein